MVGINDLQEQTLREEINKVPFVKSLEKSNVRLFRGGIRPEPHDPKNKLGSRWSLTCSAEEALVLFLRLAIISADQAENIVNGVVMSCKSGIVSVSVWVKPSAPSMAISSLGRALAQSASQVLWSNRELIHSFQKRHDKAEEKEKNTPKNKEKKKPKKENKQQEKKDNTHVHNTEQLPAILVHGNGTKPLPKQTTTKTTNMTNRQHYQQGPTHAQMPLHYGTSVQDPAHASDYVMLNGQNQPQTVGWQATEMYPMHQTPTQHASAQSDPNKWQQVSGWDQAMETPGNAGFTAPAGLFFGLQSSAPNMNSSAAKAAEVRAVLREACASEDFSRIQAAVREAESNGMSAEAAHGGRKLAQMRMYGIDPGVNPGVNFSPTSGYPLNTWNASPTSVPPPPIPTQRPQPARPSGHQKKASEDIDVLGLMMEAEERRRASMEDQIGRPWTEISPYNATPTADNAEWPSMGQALTREGSKSSLTSLSSWVDVQEGKSESSASM